MISVSIAREKDFSAIGKLMVDVYSHLDGFASPDEQPAYYEMLANIADFAGREGVEILFASKDKTLLGAVVYINNLANYGAALDLSGERDAAGFRLLAVSGKSRGLGVGKLLTNECLKKAKDSGKRQVIIHTTASMKVAWSMYERMGFKRSEDLNFLQNGLPVYGFRFKF